MAKIHILIKLNAAFTDETRTFLIGMSTSLIFGTTIGKIRVSSVNAVFKSRTGELRSPYCP